MTDTPPPAGSGPGGETARLTIDLAALAANWRDLRALAPGARCAAVVKADAYGIGLEPAVAALAAAGCATFFVATPAEGLRAVQAAPTAAVYILDGLPAGTAGMLSEAGLRPCLGSLAEIEEWAAHKHRREPHAAIHVDTGMNRLGIARSDRAALTAASSLAAAAGADFVMSHLACADEPDHPMNRAQLEAFTGIRGSFPSLPASLANSAGVFLGPDYHFDLLRPGIALYGAAASKGRQLRTVVTAEARVLQVRDVPPGATVGYGAAQRMARPSRIAVLGAGYADGYHRVAGGADARPGAKVSIRGALAPVAGRVSMDLMAVDVTDIPGVVRGDWAELFGPTVPVDEVAASAGTIGYELLTALGRRYRRIHHGGAAVALD